MDETLNQEQQDVETPAPEKREDKRIKNLSEKVETTAKERDEFKSKAQTLEREAGFYKDFTGMVSKYPQATEYQDQIKEKVMKGYDVHDATVSLLVKEGKYNPQPKQVENPAGGSAINQPTQAKKSVSEMTRDEMLAELKLREKSGDLSLN